MPHLTNSKCHCQKWIIPVLLPAHLPQLEEVLDMYLSSKTNIHNIMASIETATTPSMALLPPIKLIVIKKRWVNNRLQCAFSFIKLREKLTCTVLIIWWCKVEWLCLILNGVNMVTQAIGPSLIKLTELRRKIIMMKRNKVNQSLRLQA